MKQARLGTVVPGLILLLFIVSCDRFNGSSNVVKPTKVVDLTSMAGKSLQEMTTMLGPPRQQVLCYHWELSEGEVTVCYESDVKKYMSSIDYQLKPDFGVGSLEEMMALVNINVEGKEAEKNNRRGLFTYHDININGVTINGTSCFVDVHQRGKNLIFGSRDPIYIGAHLYIQHPHIYLYPSPDLQGKDTQIRAQQTDVNLTVGSVLYGQAKWELCTGVNFTGKCKIIEGIGNEYFEKSKNFSLFGIGNTIRSLRPIEEKVR
jgi:hypothetical protein